MRAIVDSIHSQVPETIANLGLRLDLVVSLDSHLDVSVGGDERLYPMGLREIAERTGAHTAIQKLTGADLVVVVPERMLSRHAADVESQLPHALRLSDRNESVASVVRFLKSERKIDVFESPPRSLLELSRIVRGKSWLLDIDVDYMQEMQSECYTRIIKPGPGVLQSLRHVMEFVRRTKPENITISEARLAAIRDGLSAFSRLTNGLRELGYDIEEGELAASDREVLRGIAVCKEFYSKVSRRLARKHSRRMMEGNYEGFELEERAAAKEFFTAKGYDYR